MAEKFATREAYGIALAELGEKYDFFVCDADLSKATRTEIFAKKFPERFFNFGISECDMIASAAGIASCGTTVFASTFAMFAAGRAYDAVRNSVAYPGLNVKICATHAGILINEDGGSHQCIEDIALMRAIPGMTVIAPSDAYLTKAAVKAALLHQGPVYMRLGGKFAEEVVYNENIDFTIGKGIIVRPGKDVAIMAIGRMVYQALVAANELSARGVDAMVVDMASVKPIDKEMIIRCAKETGAIVTAEDHNVIGGLGSAVAEITAGTNPVPVIMVGVRDRFGMSGSYEELVSEFGLNSIEIERAVIEILNIKRITK